MNVKHISLKYKSSKNFSFICCITVIIFTSTYAVRAANKQTPQSPYEKAKRTISNFNFESLRLAINDLLETFGPEYPKGHDYLTRLNDLEKSRKSILDSLKNSNNSIRTNTIKLARDLNKLRYDALMSNPLLDFDRLLIIKRKYGQLGLPVNHKCNTGIERTGYDNEITILSPVNFKGNLQKLFRPSNGRFVGEIDLHYDAQKLLFTMPKGKSWQIYEIKTDGSGLRQVSKEQKQEDVDNFDGSYLPDGRIVFSSTASYTAVPCWHGVERACSIFIMDVDGGNMRQLCFDQDLDLHPTVLPTGQVIFSRWDYTGPMHIYLRPLMVMNPDGTGQRAIYGSNSYWPNALYYPRGIPGSPNKIVAIIAGYHGVPRMGELGILDITKGWYEADGFIQRIPGHGKPIKTVIRDNLVDKSWPKFLHPYPLSEKYFLVASKLNKKSPWGIYLVDVFDNMLPIHILPQYDLFEPIPLIKRQLPPVIPDRVDLKRQDAVVYLHDVYAGPGLDGVPRGTIKKLRIAAYHFGYPGMAGPDKIGCGGPWEVMRIIGTVPVHEDGSAMFTVPANTPLTIQTLDEQGKAVQLMRSWFTAMPGETVSCVGCHEQPKQIPIAQNKIAAALPPDKTKPWYGPARGFDFEREVQPVLDKYCISCHNGQERQDNQIIADLRSERHFKYYKGRELTRLGATRLHPVLRNALGGTKVFYTPAYEELIPYIRRVNIEDHVGILTPGEYHTDTSELIQLLKKGHYNIRLDKESWDRLITWIDLNGPCHGTWSEVGPIPNCADKRRRELNQLFGGPVDNPEHVPQTHHISSEQIKSEPISKIKAVFAAQSFASKSNNLQLKANQKIYKTIEMGNGAKMKLVRIPAGNFIMGDLNGEPDEYPITQVSINRDFWMGTCEVTNEQYHLFDPAHKSGYFTKRFQGKDGPGLSLEGPNQPVVRVSWQQALAFCDWLSKKTGLIFTLPTEAQWEYACRAGSDMVLSYGDLNTDFSLWANLADLSLSVRPRPTGGLESNITAHFGKGILESAVFGGNILCDLNFDDGTIETADIGSYKPNKWGLCDMHGNASEWTRTTYKSYPYDPFDGRDNHAEKGTKVVRGGSWCDRPKRCRSAFRLSYPAWQRVHNVGFRVICETNILKTTNIASAKEIKLEETTD